MQYRAVTGNVGYNSGGYYPAFSIAAPTVGMANMGMNNAYGIGSGTAIRQIAVNSPYTSFGRMQAGGINMGAPQTATFFTPATYNTTTATRTPQYYSGYYNPQGYVTSAAYTPPTMNYSGAGQAAVGNYSMSNNNVYGYSAAYSPFGIGSGFLLESMRPTQPLALPPPPTRGAPQAKHGGMEVEKTEINLQGGTQTTTTTRQIEGGGQMMMEEYGRGFNLDAPPVFQQLSDPNDMHFDLERSRLIASKPVIGEE